MSLSPTAIEAIDLRRNFGDKVAVAGVSFKVAQGDVFGLVGPNGAGKTTLIRVLTGQIDPSGGRAIVAGCDVTTEHQVLKTRIGVVFEDQNLYERLSARDNLRFMCWLYNLADGRCDELLAQAGLAGQARQPVHTFSTGMKQRLMIARALLHQPPVLFLDEPTRGLDPLAAAEVRLVIRAASQSGTTILLTTHQLAEAEHLCHSVGLLVQGRLVAQDTPRNLMLQHETTLEEVFVRLAGTRPA